MAQLLNQEMQIFLLKFDTDGDGRISMDEIESFLKQNGNGNTAGSGANGAMTANDLDGNGYIDGLEEIAAFMNNRNMAQILNQEMQIFLQKFDTDGDGRISMDEIESFLKQNGNGNTAGSGANGAMTANDLDGNGYIDGPEEIAAFMKYAKDTWKGINV
ncbi:hypothetical protein NE237_008626 [Protea cynaroides]|uniref:EF-hand domain-containing protein n=1 Tax=Protea cynaroides TaxID=273540 RepID=A0A9Q0KW83_9MAGN|nr:hypothetical protein NE237_008626 [Protea cynaroides]